MFNRPLATIAAVLLTSGAALADISMPFALDWRFEGPSAPYLVAVDQGHFAAEGLTVEVTAGEGSLDAIPKVATGA
ncbi:MAG: ABC transporter substrate-binding protein, partial [Paracoccus sp. (in: a-proteobacteria)]